MRTSRKVEALAAACYAGSYILWVLGNEYKFFGPEAGPPVEELTDMIHVVERPAAVSNWEACCLFLLLTAAGLTAAAIRVRKFSEQNP